MTNFKTEAEVQLLTSLLNVKVKLGFLAPSAGIAEVAKR